MNTTFKVTGGMYPGSYRSTTVEVETEDRDLGYQTVKSWAKKNFPDWNHISPVQSAYAMVKIKPIIKVAVFVSKNNTPWQRHEIFHQP